MLVSICIPTVRTGSVTSAIGSILAQTCPDWELILVPQGDDPALVEALEQYRRRDERITIAHAGKPNLSNARNVGAAVARGDILAFTDDDCEVAPNWVEVMIREYTRHPEVEFLGGAVVAPKNTQPWRISTCPAAHVIDAIYKPSDSDYRAPDGFYMIGANITMRRSVYDKVGPFDVVLGAGAPFPNCEDQDFGLRAEALDVCFMSSTELVVHHTYGRRYGLRSFLRHQRNYAVGRGAWVMKLSMWGHRLGTEWSARPTRRAQLRTLVRSPHRFALALYAGRHARRGAQEYARHYRLGDDLLSHPRHDQRSPSAGEPPAGE